MKKEDYETYKKDQTKGSKSRLKELIKTYSEINNKLNNTLLFIYYNLELFVKNTNIFDNIFTNIAKYYNFTSGLFKIKSFNFFSALALAL